MDNKDKSNILVEFIQRFNTNEMFSDFFDYNDLGLPLAVALNADLCTLNKQGQVIFDETWEMLCTELSMDSSKNYTDLDEMLFDQIDSDENEE